MSIEVFSEDMYSWDLWDSRTLPIKENNVALTLTSGKTHGGHRRSAFYTKHPSEIELSREYIVA